MAITSDAFVVADRYEVGEVIGRGGMGEVRRGHDRRLHRDVAIKFLRPDLSADAEARRRFADEARNAARLTHPNVVQVYDTGEHDGQPYLVMERLPGRTLRDAIKAGPLPPAQVDAIEADVRSALDAAHSIGIVHRDVTPANILLTDDGQAKLADFGISKAEDSATVTMVNHVVGTPAYLSPARLRGEPATPESDFYGLDVTMAEARTGTRAMPIEAPLAAPIPWWRERRMHAWTIAATVMVGLLLLLATDTDPRSPVDASDESTPPRPTVSVTPPTTMAVVPPTTAASEGVVVRVGPGPKDDDDPRPKRGKGREKDDD